MATPKSTRISLFNHVAERISHLLPHEYNADREQETKAFFRSQTYENGEQYERVGIYVELQGSFMNFEVRVQPVFDPLDEGLAGGLPELAYPLILDKQSILNESFDGVIQDWIQHHIYDNLEKTVHKAFDAMNPEPENLTDQLLGTPEEEPQENLTMPDTQETVVLNPTDVNPAVSQEHQAQEQETRTERNAITIDIVYKVLKLHTSGVNDATIAEVLSNETYSIDVETVSTLITKVNAAGFQTAQ